MLSIYKSMQNLKLDVLFQKGRYHAITHNMQNMDPCTEILGHEVQNDKGSVVVSQKTKYI